jgi:hypothetical protein
VTSGGDEVPQLVGEQDRHQRQRELQPFDEEPGITDSVEQIGARQPAVVEPAAQRGRGDGQQKQQRVQPQPRLDGGRGNKNPDGRAVGVE